MGGWGGGGWNEYRNKSQHRKLTESVVCAESAQKVDPREDVSLAAPAGDSNPQTFDHESGALTTELSSLPKLQGLRHFQPFLF